MDLFRILMGIPIFQSILRPVLRPASRLLLGLIAVPLFRFLLRRVFRVRQLDRELEKDLQEWFRGSLLLLAATANMEHILFGWLVKIDWLDRADWIAQARELLRQVQLGDRMDQPAASLPHGDQRKLEVALLMALDPKVYMFDEPTAGMSLDDAPVVLDLIRALKARRDRTILLVEHKMDVVRELSDRIVVLHNGRLVADGAPAEVIASPVVQQAYLGLAAEEEAAA